MPADAGFFWDVFGVVGLVSGRVQRGREWRYVFVETGLVVGTCSAWAGYCRDMFGEVFLVSGRDRRGRFNARSCSTRSG